MTNEEKAIIYDECVRESDILQRENSKIKSQYPIDIPLNMLNTLRKNEARIATLVGRLENLFK